MALPLTYYVLVANLLTAYYSTLKVQDFFTTFLSNPLHDIWAVKEITDKPAPLSDSRYGEHKFVTANNVSLHYVISGDASKPLMLFLHGFPEIWYTWRYQILEFQKDYRCVAVDMRGYGESEKPDGIDNYKIELLIADINDLIVQLGYENCILVAHDWGGVVASKFRDFYPQRLKALVLLSSTTLSAWFKLIWENADQRQKSGYFFLNRVPLISELRFRLNNLIAFDQLMIVPGKNVTALDVQCFKYYFSKPNAFTPPLNYYRANFMFRPFKEVHKDNVPFLAVLGSKEKYLNFGILDAMKEEYTHIETQILDGVSHFMQQEDPDVVNAAIRTFLQSHSL